MLYGLDDLVTDVAYACALRKSEAKRFYHALVQQLEHLMRQGKGARCPGLGRWSFLANSRRQKGSAVGMDVDEDLRAAWFIGFAFEADPTFLRAHSLAAAPAPHELVAPAARVNYSALARSCGLDRDQVSRVTHVFCERLGVACSKYQVRLELGNLGRFCADHRICRFDFGARAPRPLGLSTTYDAAFTRAGRDPPPSSRPMTSPIQVASSTTTPRNHRSARRSRPTYDVSAGHTPRPVGGFDREWSSGPSTADDLEKGRRAERWFRGVVVEDATWMGDVMGRFDGGGSRPARVNAASYVVDRPRGRGARAPKSKRQMRWSAQKRPRFPSSKRTWCLLHATPNRSQNTAVTFATWSRSRPQLRARAE